MCEREEPVSRPPQQGVPSAQAKPFINSRLKLGWTKASTSPAKLQCLCDRGARLARHQATNQDSRGCPGSQLLSPTAGLALEQAAFSPRMQKTPGMMVLSRHQYRNSKSDYKLLPHELEPCKQILILCQSNHLRGELPLSQQHSSGTINGDKALSRAS